MLNKTINKYFNFLQDLSKISLLNDGFDNFNKIILKHKVDKSISKVLTVLQWVKIRNDKKYKKYIFRTTNIIKDDAVFLLNALKLYKYNMKNNLKKCCNECTYKTNKIDELNIEINSLKHLNTILYEQNNSLNNKISLLKDNVNNLNTELTKIKQTKIYKLYTWFHK